MHNVCIICRPCGVNGLDSSLVTVLLPLFLFFEEAPWPLFIGEDGYSTADGACAGDDDDDDAFTRGESLLWLMLASVAQLCDESGLDGS